MIENAPIIRCLAVDDEPHALQLLQLYVEKIPWVELVHTTTAPLEALDWLRKNEVDLLFLDIQMNDLTGLQLLDIADLKIPVVLTTAYSEYALQGYEYRVLDYLLKPYSFERFLKAVEKVRQLKTEKLPLSVPGTREDTQVLFVKGDAKNKFHRISIPEIKYIEGLRNYIHIICNDKKVVTLQNLKTILKELPERDFVRVHKSFIINVNQIELIDGHVVNIAGKRIPVGNTYRDDFYQKIEKRRML